MNKRSSKGRTALDFAKAETNFDGSGQVSSFFWVGRDLDILRQPFDYSNYSDCLDYLDYLDRDQRQMLQKQGEATGHKARSKCSHFTAVQCCPDCAGGYCCAVGGTERLPEDYFVSPLLPCHRAAWGEDTLHAPVFRWSRRGTAFPHGRCLHLALIGFVRLVLNLSCNVHAKGTWKPISKSQPSLTVSFTVKCLQHIQLQVDTEESESICNSLLPLDFQQHQKAPWWTATRFTQMSEGNSFMFASFGHDLESNISMHCKRVLSIYLTRVA